MEIHRLELRLSNAYLLMGDRPVLVDTGSPGEAETIRSKLSALGVATSDLSLIVHTHVHSDHMGSTLALSPDVSCPIAFHRADQVIADRGHNGRLVGIGWRGKIMSRLLSGAKFEAIAADLWLDGETDLRPFGVDAKVIHTPGHTPGSVSLLTSAGDAIVGDLLMGGYMGGQFLSRKPNYHYFADDLKKALKSLQQVVSMTSGSLYVGHGGPLAHTDVRGWLHRVLPTKS